MKRIALCLYGNFNNRLSATSGKDGTQYIKEVILEGRVVDVFIHSWDLDNKEIITKEYGPYLKAATFEKQIDFNSQIDASGIIQSDFDAPGGQNFRTIANSFSFYYTRKKSIELKKQYEEKMGFKYDVAIVSRFDLGQIDKYNGYQEYLTSEITFDENLDMGYLYTALFNQLNLGYADMWFYSSSENIDTVGSMFDRAFLYYRSDSQYIKTLTTGWPDSNAADIFSNEVLKADADRSGQLMTFTRREAHNNHILHKWFMLDVGMYSKTRFLGIPSRRFCTIMYSHSDYADVWPAYFSQNSKHSVTMGKKFLFVNKLMDHVPSDYEQIIYNDNNSYPERLIQCFKQVSRQGFQSCLFEHEDMILYKSVDFEKLKAAVSLVLKPTKGRFLRNGFDAIRLIKAPRSVSIRTFHYPYIFWMTPFSKWLFSVQPTLWKIESFVSLLQKNTECNIWQLEVKAQKTCRELALKCGYMHIDGHYSGMHHTDNKIYPYIATAIVKGKWNFSEYREVLPKILNENLIDPNIRGIF